MRRDTNVPLIEAEQLVAALRERGASPGYLVLPDEGHEILGTTNPRSSWGRSCTG